MRKFHWVAGLLMLGCAFPTEGGETSQSDEEIIGGSAATITDHPWLVHIESLAVYNAGATQAVVANCGGSIISKHWVMTAQHCLSDIEVETFTQEHVSPYFMTVTAGTDDLADLTNAQVRDVVEYVIVPGFTGNGVDGADVALVRVKPPFDLNGSNVKAIKLLRPQDESHGYADPDVPGVVAGWGLTSNGGSGTDNLQEIDVSLLDNPTASGILGTTLGDDMIAAFSGSSGVGICSGDSGGALVVDRNGQPRLAGVASFVTGTEGNPCAQGYPDVYARASAFLDWTKTIRSTDRTKVQDVTLPLTGSGTTLYYSLTVPEGAVTLDVRLKYGASGAGEADMAAFQTDGSPTTVDPLTYDCYGRANAAEEYCPIPDPTPGTWWVRVTTPTAYDQLRLVSNVRTPKP